MSNVAANSLVGSTLGGKYEIEALVGEGAMGSVYRAHQTSLQKAVAIKVLHRKLADQPAFVQRFQREAYSASLLDHPNSLRVLDFGETDGMLYLVMEFAQGEDLLTVMERDWPLEERRIVDVVSQALAALATAHDLGIIHRDLKPENILLLRGTDDEGKPVDQVKVCDFGIAKLLSTPSERGKSFSRRLTTEGFVVGTPDFMSPEQARGQEIDGRSDLYSMGVVLYQMLAGTLPFTADTPLGVALQHISDLPLPPSKHASKVNPHLEAICMRALSKNPEERFENAREMRRALRGALESGGAPASSVRAAAPRPHPTDMTSVPASSATPSLPRFRTGLAGYLFRRPATSRGWAVMVAAAVVAFGALSFLVTLITGRGSERTAVATTNDTVVLASPSPPSPTPWPGRGAASWPPHPRSRHPPSHAAPTMTAGTRIRTGSAARNPARVRTKPRRPRAWWPPVDRLAKERDSPPRRPRRRLRSDSRRRSRRRKRSPGPPHRKRRCGSPSRPRVLRSRRFSPRSRPRPNPPFRQPQRRSILRTPRSAWARSRRPAESRVAKSARHWRAFPSPRVIVRPSPAGRARPPWKQRSASTSTSAVG